MELFSLLEYWEFSLKLVSLFSVDSEVGIWTIFIEPFFHLIELFNPFLSLLFLDVVFIFFFTQPASESVYKRLKIIHSFISLYLGLITLFVPFHSVFSFFKLYLSHLSCFSHLLNSYWVGVVILEIILFNLGSDLSLCDGQVSTTRELNTDL